MHVMWCTSEIKIQISVDRNGALVSRRDIDVSIVCVNGYSYSNNMDIDFSKKFWFQRDFGYVGLDVKVME